MPGLILASPASSSVVMVPFSASLLYIHLSLTLPAPTFFFPSVVHMNNISSTPCSVATQQERMGLIFYLTHSMSHPFSPAVVTR